MRAAVIRRYGPPEVVRLEDRPTPTPGPREVLVRVRAAAVTSGDARIRGARFPTGFGVLARPVIGLRGPRRQVLGVGFSGEVAAVGEAVGEAVAGPVCGTTGMALGAHAEYVVLRAERLVPKPAAVSHQEAAGVSFGGTTALHYLRDRARLRPGQTVLVNGAAGAVGTSAVQIARLLGARVTGVASAANAELVRSLGAGETVDYHQTPVTQLAQRYDVVMDCVGNLTPRTGRALLTPGGVLLLVVASLAQTVGAHGPVKAGMVPDRPADLAQLLDWIARGELSVVIDQELPLEDIAEAYRLVDGGHKVGNVLVRP